MDQTREFVDSLASARRVFVAAAGRSFLAVKFFGMRLMQIGKAAFVVGDVCTPSVRDGDLVVIVSGSGETEGMVATARKARSAGAGVAVVTEHPGSTLAGLADRVLVVALPVPDSTLDDRTEVPRGNAWEPAVIVILDAIVCELMRLGKIPLSTILRNHANLE